MKDSNSMIKQRNRRTGDIARSGFSAKENEEEKGLQDQTV